MQGCCLRTSVRRTRPASNLARGAGVLRTSRRSLPDRRPDGSGFQRPPPGTKATPPTAPPRLRPRQDLRVLGPHLGAPEGTQSRASGAHLTAHRPEPKHPPRGARRARSVAGRSCRGRGGPPGRALAPPPAPTGLAPLSARAHLGHPGIRCAPPRRAPGLALRTVHVSKCSARGGMRGRPGAGRSGAARGSRKESHASRPGPCRRRHLPGRQLGMRSGPAPGPDINNPEPREGGWEALGEGVGGAAGAGARGAGGQVTLGH